MGEQFTELGLMVEDFDGVVWVAACGEIDSITRELGGLCTIGDIVANDNEPIAYGKGALDYLIAILIEDAVL